MELTIRVSESGGVLRFLNSRLKLFAWNWDC